MYWNEISWDTLTQSDWDGLLQQRSEIVGIAKFLNLTQNVSSLFTFLRHIFKIKIDVHGSGLVYYTWNTDITPNTVDAPCFRGNSSITLEDDKIINLNLMPDSANMDVIISVEENSRVRV